MKPKVAFFEFTSCEGCQLDALNLDGPDLLDLVNAVDIVNFREVTSFASNQYEIAFVEGSITRKSEIAHLQEIRDQAKIVVAFGACACIGGINCLKNHLPMEEALRMVYGSDAKNYDTITARPINAVIQVDHYVRGCPPTTEELVKVIKSLLLGKKPDIPDYPVCVECKMVGNVCVFELGRSCMGPVVRAGCHAICISAGRHCWGCRGMIDNPNIDSEKEILKKYGLTPQQVIEKFKIYNTYSEVTR
jgi:sulfhydrogenase subunit delta